MARTAEDVGDGDVGGAFSEGDAVVAGGDVWVDDLDVARAADVDPVGVRAVSWCDYLHRAELNVVGREDDYVEELAVRRWDAADWRVGDEVEREGLLITRAIRW